MTFHYAAHLAMHVHSFSDNIKLFFTHIYIVYSQKKTFLKEDLASLWAVMCRVAPCHLPLSTLRHQSSVSRIVGCVLHT